MTARRARADAAQHLRRRFGHVAQGHWRRAAHAAGGRARNDGVDAGLGVRAADAAPGRARGAGRGGRRGGNELRQATILEVQRARTVIDFAARRVYAPTFKLGEWIIPRGDSIIVSIAQIHEDPTSSPIRSVSTRSVTSEPSRRRSRGSPSAAGPAAASGRRSPTWKWMSCCERCCATSPSRRRTRRGSAGTAGASPTRRKTVGESWCTGAEPRPLPTGPRWPGAAVSSPGGRSGTCTRSDSAADSPGARARPPRSRRRG